MDKLLFLDNLHDLSTGFFKRKKSQLSIVFFKKNVYVLSFYKSNLFYKDEFENLFYKENLKRVEFRCNLLVSSARKLFLNWLCMYESD